MLNKIFIAIYIYIYTYNIFIQLKISVLPKFDVLLNNNKSYSLKLYLIKLYFYYVLKKIYYNNLHDLINVSIKEKIYKNCIQ